MLSYIENEAAISFRQRWSDNCTARILFSNCSIAHRCCLDTDVLLRRVRDGLTSSALSKLTLQNGGGAASSTTISFWGRCSLHIAPSISSAKYCQSCIPKLGETTDTIQSEFNWNLVNSVLENSEMITIFRKNHYSSTWLLILRQIIFYLRLINLN